MEGLWWQIVAIIAMMVGILALFFAIWTDWLAGKKPEDDPKAFRRWVAKKGLVTLVCVIAIALPVAILIVRERMLQVNGTFEWQQAGENWRGTVTVLNLRQSEGMVKIQVDRLVSGPTSTGTTITYYPTLWTRRLQGVSGGKLYGNRRGFKLVAPVVQVMDGHQVNLNLEANLRPVEAYAGKAELATPEGETSSSGDMILVGYTSSPPTR